MTGAVYTDFSHLATLRVEAQHNPNAALEEVAGQFESLFVQMMLKSMREATIKGGLFDSSQMETYQQMADQQVALQLSENGGIGLARVLVEQMQSRGHVPPADAPDTEGTDEPAALPISGNTEAKGFAVPAAVPFSVDRRA